MIRFLAFSVCALVWIAAPASSPASEALESDSSVEPMVTEPPQRVDVPFSALLEAVTGWVAADLGLPHPAEPPRVVFVEPSAMAAARQHQQQQQSERLGVGAGSNTVAFYNTRTRTIHLPADWTGGTASELSILVHEMVHHLQAVSDQRFACPAAREKDAFAAQERWLAIFGKSLEEAVGITPLTRLVATNCMF